MFDRLLDYVLLCVAFVWFMSAVALGCAHDRHGPNDISRSYRKACKLPARIVVSSDTSQDLIRAIETSADHWNKAAGHELLMFVGTVELESNEKPPAWSLVVVQQRPTGDTPEKNTGNEVIDMHHRGGHTIQYLRGGCAFGAWIVIYSDDIEYTPELEYRVKHELGHSIGLPHGWWGVMAPSMPAWLYRYYLAGGGIDPYDVRDLRRLYNEVQK